MIFLKINWLNFVYLFTDPGYLSPLKCDIWWQSFSDFPDNQLTKFHAFIGWSEISTPSPSKLLWSIAPFVCLFVCILDGVWLLVCLCGSDSLLPNFYARRFYVLVPLLSEFLVIGHVRQTTLASSLVDFLAHANLFRFDLIWYGPWNFNGNFLDCTTCSDFLFSERRVHAAKGAESHAYFDTKSTFNCNCISAILRAL